ncbi:MAG: FAD-dependent monooxygenase [Proteobacteria bacterium]|nr:FAD-dependent monooxygenase [Pseudomonadota bacterium]
MQTTFDAIIIGAGPAGSTAALLLARAGWSVALIEKQYFPRRKVCGECLAASNLSILDELGIGEAFRTAAGPQLQQVAFVRSDNQVLAKLPAARVDGRRWGRALGRETLDTLLRDQADAKGVTVLQPWAVQAVNGGVGDWHIGVRSVESHTSLTLHAPVAIAANGSWEALPSDRPRRQLQRRAADLFAFKANFRSAAQPEGLLSVLALEGGYGGIVLADGGITTVACCVRRDRLEACRRAEPGLRAGEAVEVWLTQTCLGVRKVLTTAQREGPWLAAGPLDPGVRMRANDAMFRIGNAAGEAHPIVGEGMSMALQSAWLLCAQLLDPAKHKAQSHHGLASPTWQSEVAVRYATTWRREFVPRLRLAATFAHAAMRPACSAALMTVAQMWPGLLTRGASWAGKTRDITLRKTKALQMPARPKAEENGAKCADVGPTHTPSSN